MRPSNSPSPSAPPMVQSNPQTSGRTVQMPQPFGSGIGFKPQVINQSLNQSSPFGYPNVAQQSHHPNYAPQSTPPINQYPSSFQTPTNYLPPQNNFSINPPVQHNYQNYQNTPPHGHGQGHPNYNFTHSQTPPNVYPILANHSVPFSYTQPNANLRRSTSGYMRKVNLGKLRMFRV